MISFNQVPSNARKPLFYAEVDNSKANLYSQNLKTIMFAQTLNVAEAVPTFVGSVNQAVELFGKFSMAHFMAKKYFQNNIQNELWIIPLADETAGTQAEYAIQVTEATLTVSKTIVVNVGGTAIEVNLAKGSTDNNMAEAIKLAVPNYETIVTATNATNTATLKVNHKGLTVGDLAVSVKGIETTIVKTNGTGDPLITQGIIDLIGDKPFEYFILPYVDSTRVTTLTDLLDARWNPILGLYGHVWTASEGTVAELKVLGETHNNEHLTVVGVRNSIDTVYETLVAYVGQVAGSLSIDPARPLQTLELAGIKPVLPHLEFNYSETTALLYAGISPLMYESGDPAIVRCISTYRVNAFGQLDVSYLDTNTLMTLARVIRTLRGVVTSTHARKKLARDGAIVGSGRAIVTPSVIRGDIIAVYQGLINEGLVEDAEEFAKRLVVEINKNDPNRIDVLLPADLINQLRIFAVNAQFYLNFNK